MNNNFQKRRNKRPNKKRDVSTLSKYLEQNSNNTCVPKLRFISDTTIVDLYYNDNITIRNNATLVNLSWRYRMNSVYDPDPNFLTGSVAGHTEYANFYAGYRVLKFHISIQLSNLDLFPVDIVTLPTNLDIGANVLNPLKYGMEPYSKILQIGSINGSSTGKSQSSIDLGKFYGNNAQYLGDDAFGAATNTNPLTTMFFNICILSPFPFINGVLAHVRLTYTVAYYDRLNLFS